MYPVEPRIISLEFFSIRETLIDENPEIEIILITKSHGQDLQRFLSNHQDLVSGKIPFSSGQRLPIKQREVIDLMIQMTECLHWMHTNHFLHGDLKLDNFLIIRGPDPEKPFEGAQICLVDLGQSRKSDATSTAYGFVPFKAPEFVGGRTRKTDIFAFGMTLMQLLCPDRMDEWILLFGEKKTNEPGVIPLVPEFDADLKGLITLCLSGDPNLRPTTEEILSQLKQIREKPESENDLPRDVFQSIWASSSSSSSYSFFSSSSYSFSSSSSSSSLVIPSLNEGMGNLSLNSDP